MCADLSGSRGNIEDLNSPATDSVGDSSRICVSDAGLGQAHGIDSSAFAGHCVSDTSRAHV